MRKALAPWQGWRLSAGSYYLHLQALPRDEVMPVSLKDFLAEAVKVLIFLNCDL